MRKIVCGCFGTIYDATILKNGLMSETSRRECTDECVDAVAEHLTSMKGFQENHTAGYEWDSEKYGKIVLRVYDASMYKLAPIKHDEKEQDK